MAKTPAETTPSTAKQTTGPRRNLTWGDLGPRLVPVFAVITAMLFGGVFMIMAGTDWDAARGAYPTEGAGAYLRELGPGIATAGTADEALIEGATGFGYIDPTVARAQTTVFTLVPLGQQSIVFIPRNLIDTVVRT